MDSLPDYLNARIYHNENKLVHYFDILMKDLRKSVTIFILTKDLKQNFYNLSDFFLKYKINDDLLKTNLRLEIVQELKNFGWELAYVFNKTAIIISEDSHNLNNSIWKTSLDFELI